MTNKLALDLLDRDEFEEKAKIFYEDLRQNRKPDVGPSFIALLLAVFANGLQSADPNDAKQRIALQACGWVPKPANSGMPHVPTADHSSTLEHSFLNVRVSGLTGFPGQSVRLTPQFTVRAWHESLLKALHLADFLARPSLTSLQALFIMGLSPYDHIQRARGESLASVAFVLARKLKLHVPICATKNAPQNVAPKHARARRMWWAMLLQDCQKAIATGEPCSVPL